MKYFDIFPWNTNFETGLQKVDKQHKKLVELLNQLANHLVSGSGELELTKTFQELTSYADYHFKLEEGIWEQYLLDDPYYASHLSTHAAFLNKLLALKNNTEKSSDETAYELVVFLSKWLTYHILDTDKRMALIIHELDKGKSLPQAKVEADDYMSGAKKTLFKTMLSMYETLSFKTLGLMREKALRQQAEEALYESEERWKFILEGGVENVWDWDLLNNRASSSEIESPFLTGKTHKTEPKVTVHPADIHKIKKAFNEHLQGKTDFFACKYRIQREEGKWSWFLSRGKIVERDHRGQALRMVGTHSDITERELAAEIFKNSFQAIMITDLDNNIISVNAAFTNITGYKAEEVIGRNPKLMSSGQHAPHFYRQMWDSIQTLGYWRGELYNRRKNGEIYPGLLMINTVRDPEGNIDHYFAIFDDITEKKKADELIFEQAYFDQLTKLPNRRMLSDRLEQELRRSESSGLAFALLMVDINNFKDVNDALGHDIGDLLLKAVAKRIESLLRPTDTISRVGSDEFAMILPEINEMVKLEQTVEKLIEAVNQPFELNSHQVHISISGGISIYPDDGSSASKLFQHADRAMHQAKKSSRSSYYYHTPSMQEEARKRQLMMNDLYRALDAQQFELFYQPIVDLQSGRIRKAEALIRWKHPRHGYIPPNEFISFAEESGLIVEIGDWVYREAMRQNKNWVEQYDSSFKVSVNISPVQFRYQNQIQQWLKYLDTSGMSGSSSVIEITETLLMENEDQIAEKLSLLRNEDIKLSLDDFGTGYSSLSYLRKFDIDYVKIDKSFVMDLAPDSQDIPLCAAMITMAHQLGIQVIAEGVETEYQKRLLRELGCNYGQGFLFSKPVPAKAFETLLKRGRPSKRIGELTPLPVGLSVTSP